MNVALARPRASIAWSRLMSAPVVALLVALLSWRPVQLVPLPGLDNSWQAGLALAVHSGIAFGDHAIFNLGPLGFLINPQLWQTPLAVLAFAYLLLVHYALALALYLAARRSF